MGQAVILSGFVKQLSRRQTDPLRELQIVRLLVSHLVNCSPSHPGGQASRGDAKMPAARDGNTPFFASPTLTWKTLVNGILCFFVVLEDRTTKRAVPLTLKDGLKFTCAAKSEVVLYRKIVRKQRFEGKQAIDHMA